MADGSDVGAASPEHERCDLVTGKCRYGYPLVCIDVKGHDGDCWVECEHPVAWAGDSR